MRTAPSRASRLGVAAGAVAVVLAGAGCAAPADPIPVAAPAVAPAAAPAPTAPIAEPSPSRQPAPEPAATDAEPAAPDVEPGSPGRIRVGSIDVDAAVVPVGVDGAGQMEVPQDVRTIGWYRFGAGLGEDGSVVLSGHVDDRVQGRGAFFHLVDTAAGDTVEVDTGDGPTLTYRVSSVRNYGKSELPLEDVFGRSGPSRLVLITCGGEFDSSTGHYTDNIVVTATPV